MFNVHRFTLDAERHCHYWHWPSFRPRVERHMLKLKATLESILSIENDEYRRLQSRRMWSQHRASYTVQSPYQMGTFAPCPVSLSQLVDSRKALVRRNLSVSKRCTFLFPTSRLIRPSISGKSMYEKQVARTNMVQSEPF
jgi:hypothetical protein